MNVNDNLVDLVDVRYSAGFVVTICSLYTDGKRGFTGIEEKAP